MPQLSHADQSQLLTALRELYAHTEMGALREFMARLACRVVAADFGSFNEFSRIGARHIASTRFPDVAWMLDPHLPAFNAYFFEHPVLQFTQRTGRQDAQRISDVASVRQFNRGRLYNEYYLPVGVRRQMVFSIDRNGRNRLAVALNRGGRDFSARDRVIFDLLRPHFAQAHDNVAHFSNIRRAVAELERAHDSGRQALMVIDAAGRVCWLSKLARQWLNEHLGVDVGEESRVPEPIGTWLQAQRETRTDAESLGGPLAPLRLKGLHGTLSIRFAGEDVDGNLSLLLTHAAFVAPAAKLNVPGLTPRENDVLGWIAQGKSNPEIAVILGLSVRTVYKHVENIFPKLGVDNRAAAMLRALETR